MRERVTVGSLALLASGTFVLAGILGFVPGVTTHYGEMELAGHASGAELLGAFQVSVLHNVVHLLLGAVGLALARTSHGARTFLVGGGTISLVLGLFGLVVDKSSSANFVPLDSADDWLHLALGSATIVLALGAGVAAGERSRARCSPRGRTLR